LKNPRMNRALIIGAVLLIAGIGIAIYGYFTNRVSIPDADVLDLNLNGRLILAHGMGGVTSLDLSTAESQALFTAPDTGIVTAASLSPDGSTLILAYAPPPTGLIQFGYTDLYSIPTDGSEAPQLLVDAQDQDVLYSPTWPPDGKTVYYVRSHIPEGALTAQLSIEYLTYPDGEPKTLLEDSSSPDLSPDGTKLAYTGRPSNSNFDSLYVSNLDGQRAQTLAGSERFLALDRPSFSPDGKTVAFSGDPKPFIAAIPADKQKFAFDWSDLLLGTHVAHAHDVGNSSVWILPVSGGTPQLIAKLQTQGLILDYSPDGQHIAFIDPNGLFVMNADGTHLVRISNLADLRSIQWVP